jgi:type III pantothenate kinase
MSYQPGTTYLSLDNGNTSMSMAAFRNHRLLKVSAIEKKDTASLKEFISRWKQERPHCIISSVAKEDASLLKLLQKNTRLMRLSPRLKLPVKNDYGTPETLGNDRLACITGAYKLFPGINVLVIDMGTCIKYDFIDFRGVYQGGSISPGLQMRFKALHHYTSALPLIQPKSMADITGRNTKESILSGVQKGIQFEIEGFINSYQKQYKNLHVVVTGGDRSRLAKHLKNDIFAAPHLIHIGLYEILYYNLA